MVKAEEALKSGRKEEATVLLRAAREFLPQVKDERARTALRGSITDLLKKADGNHAARAKAEGDAARGLRGIAEAYAGAEWHRTALELLQIAGALDPEAVATDLADARLRLEAADKAKERKPPGPFLGGVAELLARADAALARGDREEAAAAARIARREAGPVPGDAARGVAAAELIKKVDDLDGVRREAETLAARQLIAVADAYARAKWPRLCLDLLLVADALDPEAARRPLDEARKKPGAESSVRLPDPRGFGAGRDQLLDFFKDGRQPFAKGWKVGPDGATSPSLGDNTTMILSGPSVAGDARIGIDFLLGRVNGKVGLAFGVQSPTDYLVLEVHHDTGETVIRLVRVHEADVTVFWEETTRYGKDVRADWMRMTLELHGGEATVTVADETFRPRRVGTVDGQLGLFISGNSENKKPVRFRGLRVERL